MSIGRRAKRSRKWQRIATIGVVAIMGVTAAYAFNSLLNGFINHYSGTTIPLYTSDVTGDSCATCHTAGGFSAPGNAYREALIGAALDFAAIDMVDSDGDGVDNETESLTARVDPPTEVNGGQQVGYTRV